MQPANYPGAEGDDVVYVMLIPGDSGYGDGGFINPPYFIPMLAG